MAVPTVRLTAVPMGAPTAELTAELTAVPASR
jgi:hypothetical protein